MFLLDFLFPKDPKIIELEKLSSEKLLDLLPPHSLPFDYGHPLVKEVVWEIKYKGNMILAEKIGILLYDTIIDALTAEKAILVPIPISDKRRFERGWNQAELLCQAIKGCDSDQRLKFLPRQLYKPYHTENQTKTTTKKERLNNLRNSMRVANPAAVADKCVILIDDVTTTGATFAEAKRALKEAGAKKVLCFAIAH